MSQHSAYSQLGLTKGASDNQIKQAWIELVKRYDPERHTERFMVIQDAYNRLKDPRKRAVEDLHTYNFLKPEFLFAPEEKCDPANAPTDDTIEEAREEFKAQSGAPAVKEMVVRLLMRRSSALVAQQKWDEALVAWSEVREIDPSHVRARQNLLSGYLIKGQTMAYSEFHGEASILWEQALALNPDNAELIHNLAIACERDGDSTRAARFWSETVARWKAQLDRDPNNEYLKELLIEAHRYHGGGSSQTGEGASREAALQRFREVLKLNPNDPEARLALARACIDDGDYPEAVRSLNELVRQMPSNVDALNLLATAMLHGGQADQAFMMWQKSLALQPSNKDTIAQIVEARLTLGREYREKGVFTQALVNLKQVLRFQPKNPDVLLEIAATYDMKGDVRAAMQGYTEVLAIDPKNKLARKALNDLKLKK